MPVRSDASVRDQSAPVKVKLTIPGRPVVRSIENVPRAPQSL